MNLNWKFWQNKKVLAVTAAAAVIVVAGTAVTVALLQPKPISQQQAESIALEHAGVAAADAVSMKVDRDDGTYEVDFTTADRSYQYTIQGSNGKVVDYSYQTLNEAQGIATMESQPSPQSGAGQQTTGSGSAVTEEEAKQAALDHAGLSESGVTFHRVEQDYDNGRAVYEVEFYAGNTEYDYEIAQDTGEILSYDRDIEDWAIPQTSKTQQTIGTGSAVTEEEAKQAALDHAGLSESSVTFHRVKQDYDNGRAVYEVEFYANNTEYDYEIAQDTGEVLSYDSDIEDWAIPQEGSPVTLEQATQLVLDRVEGLTSQDVRIHQEHDDGRTVYEGEAFYNGTEYEFEIDASTGAFLNWSSESH